jgi:hypothetical protein
MFLVPEEGVKDSVQFALLEVTNHGRSQADEVEAVLSSFQSIGPIPPESEDEGSEEIPSFDFPAVSRGVLQFELADASTPRVTIPPGATRALRFVFLAPDALARQELEERGESLPTQAAKISGGFAIWPLGGSNRITWIADDDPTIVEIGITARNSPARMWRGKIRVLHWEGMTDEPSDLSGIKLEWESPLRRIRRSTPPTPRREWLRRRTPWAVWRDRQLQRELEEARREAEAEKL